MGNGTYEDAQELIGKCTFDKRVRRIEKSVEVTMSLGNMQFLKFRNTISEDVPYESEEFRDAYSRVMQHDLAVDLRRDMVATLVDLGKTTDADKEFFDACRDRIKRGKASAAASAEKSQETQEVKEVPK